MCRYKGTGVHQLGLWVEGATVFDSGNWSFIVRHQGQVVRAEFEVQHWNRPNLFLLQVVVSTPPESPSLTTTANLPLNVQVHVGFYFL